MPKQTKADRIIETLEEQGYTEHCTNSRKYRKFTHGVDTLWVGKCGAVRQGKTISGSFSLTYRFATT